MSTYEFIFVTIGIPGLELLLAALLVEMYHA